MELEHRYIVFKVSDVDELDTSYLNTLAHLEELVEEKRREAGKAPLFGLFIERDWPEYEPTLRMLSARVDGEPVVSEVHVSPDANVEKNRQMLLERSVVGLKKYGVTTERDDLTRAEWVQHAIEEVLDLANYLQALKTNLEKGK